MSSRIEQCFAMLLLLLMAGCSSVPQTSDLASNKRSDWDWALAIPRDAPRAELVSTTVRNDHLAQLVPAIQQSNVVLVSASEHPMPASWEGHASAIAKVDGQPIQNWGQLHDATKLAVAAKKPVLVDFRDPQDSLRSAEVSPQTLVSLTQSAAGDEPVIRVSDGGNSAIMIRENGLRCKLIARVEREAGMLHLVVSLDAPLGNRQLLPTEMQAQSGSQQLRCLSVAEALEVLYGDPSELIGMPVDEIGKSFAKTSEREDYLIPSNYKRLERENKSAFSRRQVPALASIPGVRYPGSAMLGDARALTSFLLQQEFYESGQDERVGWVLFAGEALHDASEVDVDVDLGSGPRRIRFALPPR